MVTFEYSKDFKTWISEINGKRIEDYTVLGSYDVRQGYNLTEAPRASTFSMDIVSDYELAKALLEYRYIRIKRDDEVTFIGQLSPESERKIETLSQQVLSIKYVHLLNLLEEKEFGSNEFELNYIEADNIYVLNNDDPSHSLTHILVNKYLLRHESIPFVFENKYKQMVKVVDFGVRGKDKVWDVLNQLLREYGYIIRVENLSLKIVDILEDSATGIELLDGSEISAKTTDEPLVLPRVKYQETYIDKHVTLYNDRYSIGGFLGWGKVLEGDLPLKLDESEGKKMVNVTNLEYNKHSLDVDIESEYLNEDKRSYHRKLTIGFGHLYHAGRESLKGDVTYAIYRESVSPDKLPTGFSLSYDRIEPRYLYGAEQVERYIRSLARIKMFKHTQLTFYSKVRMPVDTIVRFRDIPDTTCRIFEVQDTLEMDGGYTYRAYPFDAQNMTFEKHEEYVAPLITNSILNIYTQDPIFVEDEKYKKEYWKINIQTQNNVGKLEVTVDNVPYEVFYDDDLGVYYIEVPLTDIDLKSITVTASVSYSTKTEVIPIYKTSNRPSIIEYKYSTSDKDPNADDLKILYGDTPLYYGDYLLGWGGEAWTQQIPTGAKYEGMFLWKRTWNYDLQDWVYEMLTQIEKLFQINAYPSMYPISKRNVVDTNILVKVVCKGYNINAVELSSDVGTLTHSTEFEDQWNLALPAQISQDQVHIWGTIGEVKAETFINGIVSEDAPIYWGLRADAPSGVPFVEGDYYLTDKGIPMRWNGIEWKPVESTDDNYATIMDTVSKDWLLNGHDIDESVSALYAYFGIVYADGITTRDLTLRNKGAIKSENYDESLPIKERKGFKVSADGNADFVDMTARGGVFEDIEVTGSSRLANGMLSIVPKNIYDGLKDDGYSYYAKLDTTTPTEFQGVKRVQGDLLQRYQIFLSELSNSYKPFVYQLSPDSPRVSFDWKEIQIRTPEDVVFIPRYSKDAPFYTKGKTFVYYDFEYASADPVAVHAKHTGYIQQSAKAFDGLKFGDDYVPEGTEFTWQNVVGDANPIFYQIGENDPEVELHWRSIKVLLNRQIYVEPYYEDEYPFTTEGKTFVYYEISFVTGTAGGVIASHILPKDMNSELGSWGKPFKYINAQQVTTNWLRLGTFKQDVRGYTDLPNGLRLQWGTTKSGRTEFPVPFKSICFCVVGEQSGTGASEGLGIHSWDQISFKAQTWQSGRSIYWIAIGY